MNGVLFGYLRVLPRHQRSQQQQHAVAGISFFCFININWLIKADLYLYILNLIVSTCTCSLWRMGFFSNLNKSAYAYTHIWCLFYLFTSRRSRPAGGCACGGAGQRACARGRLGCCVMCVSVSRERKVYIPVVRF